MKYDVFVSYSSEDKKIAEGVCGYLERYNIKCFVAYRDIMISEPYPKAISDAINKSSLMIAIYSESYKHSEETDREITIAAKRHIPILNFRITDDQLEGTKEYFLSDINWIDAFPNPENYFGKLFEAVQKLIDYSNKTHFFFIKNEMHDLSEPNRHAVYNYYFPKEDASNENTDSFFGKTKDCLNEMYAFHRYLNYEADKGREDYLLAEWIIYNNRIEESLLHSLVQKYGESITACLAHAIYDYRTGIIR